MRHTHIKNCHLKKNHKANTQKGQAARPFSNQDYKPQFCTENLNCCLRSLEQLYGNFMFTAPVTHPSESQSYIIQSHFHSCPMTVFLYSPYKGFCIDYRMGNPDTLIPTASLLVSLVSIFFFWKVRSRTRLF